MRKKYLEELNSARENLKEKLLEAFRANRRIYGAPRLTHELRAMGVGISRATVSRLMAELSISGACGRAKTITTRPGQIGTPGRVLIWFSVTSPSMKQTNYGLAT